MARPDSRLIRVFLSSTFVDFQEERSLLVQQVFPSLRRRARSRGVEIVDVDLRWGVTAEMTERGETLPLCLGEIDRCRPYFISLLGERYGWVPPPNYYTPELLERQPWLKERMGGASVTELEILHGVLRNPEMAGHALFYLRDPAYAEAQPEPGWVAENPVERQRLAALKSQIRASGFPVAEGLANPQAIAERIEADLWQLIESRFPEQEPADALEREGRRHGDYRRARTGLYLGGEPAIETLESWITQGEQRILITGDSGAGKSALIANWLEAHQRNQPQDLVHAHHLGCTNDASAVRPLLGRLIDTASQLLLAEQQITEALKVPQDWWELVFKVGEVFALLSPWCQRQGRRWILVLDGLDRLAEEDQQALPWIPTTIPPCIHVVASALDCTARTILQERHYRTHEIGPLGQGEQQQLIERYLSRYTKQLESGLQQQLLAHPLAGSPLFLKVLLEELRQCAWFDTLQEQVAFYLSAQSIDGLYAKVLERLENDGHGEAVRQVMTALWASRAGLSEEELLAITGLAPLQWAPIDLALEQAFGRNGEQLVFDHEFLRKAVEGRYLYGKEEKTLTHKSLAAWFANHDDLDFRKAEEWLWQLERSNCSDDLRASLLNISNLCELTAILGTEEVIGYWKSAKLCNDLELDELLSADIDRHFNYLQGDGESLLRFSRLLGNLLDRAGLFRDQLFALRRKEYDLSRKIHGGNATETLESKIHLAQYYHGCMNFSEAERTYAETYVQAMELKEDKSSHIVHEALNHMAYYAHQNEDYEKSFSLYGELRSLIATKLSPEHPSLLGIDNNLGLLLLDQGRLDEAYSLLTKVAEKKRHIYGSEHESTICTLENLASILIENGNLSDAIALLRKCHSIWVKTFGEDHDRSISLKALLANAYTEAGEHERAQSILDSIFAKAIDLYGGNDPRTFKIANQLALACLDANQYKKAEDLLEKVFEWADEFWGRGNRNTIEVGDSLAYLYSLIGKNKKAERLHRLQLAIKQDTYGYDDVETNISKFCLACSILALGCNFKEAEKLLEEIIQAMKQNENPSDHERDLLCDAVEILGRIND